jgi:hypothetical protein
MTPANMGDRFPKNVCPDSEKRKNPNFYSGFFEELEFKVFFRTVNQAGFSGIFGCFSDIG